MHDAIIIGAGHNGLAAAIHLSSRGWKVAVVEQAAVAGGAVKTRENHIAGLPSRSLRHEPIDVRGFGLGTAVEHIETNGGRAAGVRLADGRVLPARRAVIANAHPQLVFGRLLPSDPKRAAFDARIAGFRAGPGTMIIHLALDRLPDWRQAEAFTASPMCIWRPIWVLWPGPMRKPRMGCCRASRYSSSASRRRSIRAAPRKPSA